MRIKKRGLERLLAALTDQPSPITCAECLDQLPFLADTLAAGETPADSLRPVIAHLDNCEECEDLLLELLESLEFSLSEPLFSPAGKPDLSFLPLPSSRLSEIWRTTLEAAHEVIRDASDRLQAIEITLCMPETIPPLPATGVLDANNADEKLLFSRLLADGESMQVDLYALRSTGASDCTLLIEVDSVQPGAARPREIRLQSKVASWSATFNEVGQATIGEFPVAALANLDLALLFEE